MSHRPGRPCSNTTDPWGSSAGVWEELLEVQEPQKRPAKWHSPVAFWGTLSVSRSQSELAQGIHGQRWMPAPQPHPTGQRGPHAAGILWPGNRVGTGLAHHPAPQAPAQAAFTEPWAEHGAGGRRSAAGGSPQPHSRLPAPSRLWMTSRPAAARRGLPLCATSAGIWEPAEREMRNKCAPGLDRNPAALAPAGSAGPRAPR